jgi:hypothetical protein
MSDCVRSIIKASGEDLVAEQAIVSSGGYDFVPIHFGRLPFLTGIAAKVRAAIIRQAPLGYEDETGFHYGATPPSFKTRF